MNETEQLLEQVKLILNIREKTQASSGKGFTVFSAMGMETNEEKTHCRVMYELLRPDGGHGMGDQFLREFFERVLEKPFPQSAAVRREYSISRRDDEKYGRIDLLIEGQGICCPIEVKIYAGDQYRQIARYARFAKDRAPDAQVYYLTLNGHEPSEDSTGGEDNPAKCISFAVHIWEWLLNCEKLAWQKPDVAAAIRQYITLIEKLTIGQQEDAFMDAVKNTVGMSKENYESAAAIEKALLNVRIEMLRGIFGNIEAHLKDRLEPIDHYQSHCVRFYKKPHRRTYPSLNFVLARINGFRVCLRFQVDWNLFYGVFFTTDDDEWSWLPKEAQKVKDAFSDEAWKQMIQTHRGKDWLVWWRYLPDNENLLNFRGFSGAYTELYDAEGYNRIMQAIYNEIDENIESILKTGLPNDSERVER